MITLAEVQTTTKVRQGRNGGYNQGVKFKDLETLQSSWDNDWDCGGFKAGDIVVITWVGNYGKFRKFNGNIEDANLCVKAVKDGTCTLEAAINLIEGF